MDIQKYPHLPAEILAMIFQAARREASAVHFLAVEAIETQLPGTHLHQLVLPQAPTCTMNLMPRYNFPWFAKSSPGPVMADIIRQVSRLGRDLGAPPSCRLNSVGIRLDTEHDLVYLKWKWGAAGILSCVQCIDRHRYHIAPPQQGWFGHFNVAGLEDLKLLRQVAIEVDITETSAWDHDPDVGCENLAVFDQFGNRITRSAPPYNLSVYFAGAMPDVRTVYFVSLRHTKARGGNQFTLPAWFSDTLKPCYWTVGYRWNEDRTKRDFYLESTSDHPRQLDRFECPGGVLTELVCSRAEMRKHFYFARDFLFEWGLREDGNGGKLGVEVRFLRWERG
jgi:hypothetical protein